MRQKFEMAVLIVALTTVGITPGLVLAQAPAVPLEDQLKAQYTLVKMGADTGGAAVVEQGTILVIKKGGILSVPYGDRAGRHQVPGRSRALPENALMMGARGGLMGKFGKTADDRVVPGRDKSISRQNCGESAQRSGGDRHGRLRFL